MFIMAPAKTIYQRTLSLLHLKKCEEVRVRAEQVSAGRIRAGQAMYAALSLVCDSLRIVTCSKVADV